MKKAVLGAAVVAVVACGGFFLSRSHAPVGEAPIRSVHPAPPPHVRRSAPPIENETPDPAIEDSPVPAGPPAARAAPTDEASGDSPVDRKAARAKRPKRELKDPLSRKALVLVGADPGADAYWLAAINNRDLPAEERSDLIEDLNEEGLSDPDNPSRDDLPLIINRLELIAMHAPFAMDQVNADAFAEAYKDLLNMYNRLTE